MGLDILLMLVAVSITALLWIIVLALRPEQRAIAARGLRFAALASAIVGLALTLVIALLLNGRMFLFSTLDVSGALMVGGAIGLAVGLGMLWVATTVLALGMWFRAGIQFATWGSVLAVPAIVAALGLGYATFRADQARSEQPIIRPGSATLDASGAQLARFSATGGAQCAYNPSGSFSLDADVTAAEGRSATLQLGLAEDGAASIALSIDDVVAFPGKGWEPGPDTIQLRPGTAAQSGGLTFTGVVPLTANGEPDPAERWSGTVSWECEPR